MQSNESSNGAGADASGVPGALSNQPPQILLHRLTPLLMLGQLQVQAVWRQAHRKIQLLIMK